MPSATEINSFLAKLEKKSRDHKGRGHFIFGKSEELPWIKTYGWVGEEYIKTDPKLEPADGDKLFVVAQNLSIPTVKVEFECRSTKGKVTFGTTKSQVYRTTVYARSLPGSEAQPADDYSKVGVSEDVNGLSEDVIFKADARRVFGQKDIQIVNSHLTFRFGG